MVLNDENLIYNLENINQISSVVYDFSFILQDKYKIANYLTGSGNTKNIGSVRNINKLKNGEGIFSVLGKDIFDDYWMFYITKDMETDEIKIPYKNIEEYLKYKNIDLENYKIIIQDE